MKYNIYLSSCHNPYINLAAEEWLFENLKPDEIIMYLWQNEDTVVIGKNQNIYKECSLSRAKKLRLTLARRKSGGGAVFHDLGNLNFTFISSRENYDLETNMLIIKKACQMAGIITEISGRNDILAEGRKFSGNAFFNSKGKSLHHGTIMINTDTKKLSSVLTPSKAKLEAKGVKSVKSRVINLKELSPKLSPSLMKDYMIAAFKDVYSPSAPVCHISENEEITAISKKYADRKFLYNSQPPFKYICEGRFSSGSISLSLNISNGIINEVNVFTDSMDYTLPDTVKTALLGCPFNIEDIKSRLPEKIKDDIILLISRIF